MTVLVRKICLLGSFAVGKTSLCQRFVNGVFNDNYQTTVGVNIVTRSVTVAEQQIKLVIWDIAGEMIAPELLANYLPGSQGCLLVADGSRAETLQDVEKLHHHLQQHNPDIVTSCLINKADLEQQWETPPSWIKQRRQQGWAVQRSSALTGLGVEQGFSELANRLR